jgi:hypothetical protein
MDHTATICDGSLFSGTNLSIPDMVKDAHDNYYTVDKIATEGIDIYGTLTLPPHFNTIGALSFFHSHITNIEFGGTKNILTSALTISNQILKLPSTIQFLASRAFDTGFTSIYVEWLNMTGHEIEIINGNGPFPGGPTGTIYSPNGNITYTDLGLPAG